MPAINVARTDTFEKQRIKINQIGDQIFNVTAGGSDLATGNLRLGSGTRSLPSLSFSTDTSLGIYKPSNNTIGYVANSKILADFNIDSLFSYKDVILQKRSVSDSGSSIQSAGSNYDAGTYSDILLLSGTGDLATINVTVLEFNGQLTNTGSNYNPGSYTNISLVSGSGSDSFVDFTIDNIDGIVADPGSGYIPGFYTSVPVTGGSGSGALIDITTSGTTTITGSITNSGSSYTDGTYTNIELLNSPIQTFVVTAVTNLGTPPPSSVYNIDGNVQPVLNLVKGNTYAFDVSDASMATHPFYFDAISGFLNISNYITTAKGVIGTAGAIIYLIIKPTAPTETIKYDCSVHSGMGANINVITGAAGQYVTGLTANIEISGNVATSIQIASTGSDCDINQVFTVYSGDIGGTGSGLEYTISNVVYDGTVTGFTITNSGQDYQNLDLISFNNSSIGGFGSGFQFEITTDPGIIKNLTFSSRGSGNQVGDQLTLPTEVTGITTTLDDLSSTIVIPSITGIYVGMTVSQTAGTGVLGSGITVQSVDSINSSVTLSSAPQTNGSATLSFIPVYGTPSVPMVYEVGVLGPISDYSISNSGNGYSDSDVLNVEPSTLTQPIVYDVSVESTQDITFTGTTSSSNFSIGDFIKIRDGEISAVFVSGSTALQSEEGNTYTNISSSGGSGSGLVVDLERVLGGSIGTITIVNGGIDYQLNETVTIPGNLVGGSSPADDVELTVTTVSSNSQSEIFKVNESSGSITSIVCEYIDIGFSQGDSVIKVGSSTTATIDTASVQEYRYFINTGSGFSITPNLNLYVGNKYRFDVTGSSNAGHEFSLSQFRDGIFSPSAIENVNTLFSLSSKNITVASTTGIIAGMEVVVSSGVGLLPPNTYVDVVVDATTITLTEFPIASGATEVNFIGVPFTDGITKTQNYIEILISGSTPSLFYYCPNHVNMGGVDNSEALITIDPNNPKIFGSGFELLITSTTKQNIIQNNILTGDISAVSFTGSNATLSDVVISGDISTDTATVNTLTVTNINSTNLTIAAPVNLNGNLDIGSTINITESDGNISTSGILKTTNSLSVSDVLTIIGPVIQTVGPNDITLTPSSGRSVKVNSVTSLDLPAGSTIERPINATNGSVRFNTTNGQYEGYNVSTTSWSSLGGVRDIDGNTYILAELTPAANDNTLWFYNDSINTIKITPEFLDFRTVKKISSGKLGLPTFAVWTSNTPVLVGQYLKYQNNLYEVTSDGTTASSGSEPTHNTGSANNGTSQLTWFSFAVSPLEFTEIEELRVGPNKDCPLIIGQELKLDDNTISTTVQDLIIQPNAGKQVIVDSVTHFRIPAGNNNQKSIAAAGPGSIRFNTEILQFEGYSGANWSSLGGVRDVDGNTYIIPETAPAANENILYFYNNNVNTLQLTETVLDFTNIDTITTSGGNSLALDTQVFTLNSNDTTIDNSDVSRTFVSTTKQYLDLGLSSGLNVDTVLRLDNQGDVYLNTTFGSGSFNGVKVLDGELKEFELADYKISTSTFVLDKGGLESSAVVLYASADSKGCKVTVVSKSDSGKRSMSEYSVIDNGTDIFHNEYASLNTSEDGYIASFDFTASTEPRITITLTDNHDVSDIIDFTVLVQEIK